MKQLQTMLKEVLKLIGNLIPIRYFVLDGYFGNNNAGQMVQQCGLHLISKLHADAALSLPSTASEKMIDYYSLRFQIEFNFRDAKQY